MVDVQIGNGNNQSFGITFSKDFVGDIEGIEITEQFFESFIEEHTNETALGNNGTMQASAVRPGWIAGGGISALVEVISGWVSPPDAVDPMHENDHPGDRCEGNPNADCDDYENPGCHCDVDPNTGEPVCCECSDDTNVQSNSQCQHPENLEGGGDGGRGSDLSGEMNTDEPNHVGEGGTTAFGM